MKKILSWVTVNFTILGLLVIGNVYALPSLAMVATFILWLTSISTIIVVTALHTDIGKATLLKTNSKYKSSISLYIDHLFDLSVVGVLLYFSYPLLAIVYFIQIIMFNMYNRILAKYSNEAN